MPEPVVPNSDPITPPATPPDGGATPPTPPTDPNLKLEDLNKQIGEMSAKVKDYDDYKKRVEPILSAIYSDPEAYEKVNKSYQKLMGVKVDDDDKGDDKDKKKPPVEDPSKKIENDNRNALISSAVKSWESQNGIDKLTVEDKATLNNKVLTELKAMLDPMNTGKSGADLLAGVSVANVPTILEKAYYLATRNEREVKIAEDALKKVQNEELGLIGSVPGGSITESDVKLTEKEKSIAKKQGITEEKYLANKKEIMKRKGSIA